MGLVGLYNSEWTLANSECTEEVCENLTVSRLQLFLGQITNNPVSDHGLSIVRFVILRFQSNDASLVSMADGASPTLSCTIDPVRARAPLTQMTGSTPLSRIVQSPGRGCKLLHSCSQCLHCFSCFG